MSLTERAEGSLWLPPRPINRSWTRIVRERLTRKEELEGGDVDQSKRRETSLSTTKSHQSSMDKPFGCGKGGKGGKRSKGIETSPLG